MIRCFMPRVAHRARSARAGAADVPAVPGALHRARKPLALLLLCASAWAAQAQQVRDFPASALRGSLQVTAPPQVILDGHPDRLAPGARIHDMQNLFVLSGSIAGKELLVNYTRDTTGLLREVWILTPDEARLDRPSAPSASNLIFRFGN